MCYAPHFEQLLHVLAGAPAVVQSLADGFIAKVSDEVVALQHEQQHKQHMMTATGRSEGTLRLGRDQGVFSHTGGAVRAAEVRTTVE